MWSLIPILISKIGDFQLPPKSDSLFIQLMLNPNCGGSEVTETADSAVSVDSAVPG